jgi:hypothetical protein
MQLRFFERVKLMRKLKKAKSAMEKVRDTLDLFLCIFRCIFETTDACTNVLALCCDLVAPQATDKAEKKQFKQEFKHHRQDLMYIYYFPKLEQYISLFPSTAHDEDKLKRCDSCTLRPPNDPF